MSDYSNIKSSSAIIKKFTESIKEKILKPGEELSESPVSFVNILGNTIGDLVSLSFYETLMYKKECLPSTASRIKTLLRYVDSEYIHNILAKPSNFNFVLGYRKKDLIEMSVEEPNGTRKLVLNKNFKLKIASDKPNFTIDHNIEIVISPYQISNQNGSVETKYKFYAVYDLSDKYLNPISIIENPFITSRENIIIDNEEYFIMFLTGRQYERTIYEVEINSQDDVYQRYFFENHLCGFTVEYKNINENNYRLLKGEEIGINNKDGYNYEISNFENGELVIGFSNIPNYFKPTTGTLRVTLYTTSGEEGNFTISNVENIINETNFEYSQDRSIRNQDNLLTIIPIISFSEDCSYGGKNSQTADNIKDVVLNKNKNTVLSLGVLEKQIESMNMKVSKLRDDIVSNEYRIYSVIYNGNKIIPTTMANLKIDLDNSEEVSYNQQLPSTIMIRPSTVYEKYNENYYKRVKREKGELKTIEEYIDIYNNNISSNVLFPYFIRIITKDIITATPYNMFVDRKLYPSTLYFNENSKDKISITNITLYRNPISDEGRNKYKITIDVSSNPELLDSLEGYYEHGIGDSPNAKIKISIKNKYTSEEYVKSVEEVTLIKKHGKNDSMRCVVYIETNDGVSESERLCITDKNFKLMPLDGPSPDVKFVDFDMECKVICLLKDDHLIPSPYDKYLTIEEKSKNFFVSIIYEDKSNFVLCENMSDTIFINTDMIINQPVYKKYTENVPARYKEDVYETDSDGNLIVDHVENITVGDTVITKTYYKILHNKGDIIQGEFEHRVGETMVDQFGNPVLEDDYVRNTIILYGVPVFDRIFSSKNNYETVVKEYTQLIDKIRGLSTIKPDGIKFLTGVFKTSGEGSYYFKNRKTNLSQKLNNIAISLSIGVKLDNNISTSEEYIVEEITNSILDYINNLSKEEFSVQKMLNDIKNKFVVIDYFEFYSLNNYNSDICQTIYYDSSRSRNIYGEKLTVKYKVDKTIKDSNNNIIEMYLKPAIDITIL